MQLIKKISFSLLILFLHAKSYSQLDYANELASTIMKTYKDSMVVKKFGNHLLQDNQVLPGQSIEDAQMNRPAVWNYETGVILFAFEKLAQATGKNEYKDSNLVESKSIVKRLRDGFLKRAGQSEMVAAHMKTCPYKIILCGDFNDTPSSFAYHTLSTNLNDAFKKAGNGIGKTYHGSLPFLRIDYILYSTDFDCYNYKRYPESLTDHYPISCYLHLGK